MITNKNIFFAMGLMFLCQQLQASDMQEAHPNALARLPQEAFNVQADNMSFKDLYALSQTSKEDRAKVKKYFQYKENVMKNTKCPALTKEWIIEHSKKSLPMERSGFVPDRGLVQDRQEMVTIDGVKWSVRLNIGQSTPLDQLPDTLTGQDHVQEFALPPTMLEGPRGRVVVRSCSYVPNKEVDINLFLEMEKMSFNDDVPAPAK